ncbi:helix-turn-helix transcriptional regulator [Sphingomonas jatrophae]|uniref:AraC family transcriptional regulator n=1 Tax=Sphingomonas jatrophae TaxID=1166337 RepID=A0A1I6KFH5_9SPHN|nr:helix-turn-helix transcriptional regulator [Sphingomonas jatrophae]SFR89963.1 AraC family transcriptional regulator [Sphingomonas jatrophae]
METHHSHETVARLDSRLFSLQLATHMQPAADYEVYEEPDHVLALQRVQSLGACEGRYKTGGARDYSSIGRLMFLPAGMPLEVRTRCRPEQVVRCVFTTEALGVYGGACDVYDRGALSTFLNVRRREMIELMTLVGEELASPGLARETLAESLGIALLIQFARYVSVHSQGDVGYRGGLARRHLRLIKEAVEEGDRCPSLSELSELVGLSLRHLTRAFKQTTGITVYTYVEQVRLSKTKALLADTDMLMKEIAAALGFSCASSLSVAFRKLTGETPQDYRKRHRRAQTRIVVPTAMPRSAGLLLS